MLIYSVEDDASIRELIKYALESSGYTVQSFESAEQMLEVFNQKEPNLILLDIMLPGIDGLEALKIVKAKNSSIKVIMLTAKIQEINKVQGLDSGADDYMSKPFSVLELQARIRAHLRSVSNIKSKEEQVITLDNLTIDTNSHSVIVDKKEISLTNKEFQLLLELTKNMNKVITRDELLKNIWGYEYVGESRTVDIHIKNLRSKLGIIGDNIVSVRGVGYKFR